MEQKRSWTKWKMNESNKLLSIAKKPIIGEFIIFFAIFLTLGAISGTLNHFDMQGDDKKLLFQGYFGIALIYVIISLSIRIKKYLSKDKTIL